MLRRDAHALDRALGIAGAEVLAGDRRRRAHQAHRRPGDQREQLGVADGVSRLRRGAVFERADEAQQQHAADVHGDALHAGRQAEPEQRADDGEVRARVHARARSGSPSPAASAARGRRAPTSVLLAIVP